MWLGTWRAKFVVLLAVVLVAIAVLVGDGWYMSNKIREETLEPDHNGPQPDLKVADLTKDRVTLRLTPRPKKDDWRRGGTWGLRPPVAV